MTTVSTGSSFNVGSNSWEVRISHPYVLTWKGLSITGFSL
jgi:hypothetical protein